MSNLNKLKEVEMLPLSNDYVFKRIFGKGGNEKILKKPIRGNIKNQYQKDRSKKSRNTKRSNRREIKYIRYQSGNK